MHFLAWAPLSELKSSVSHPRAGGMAEQTEEQHALMNTQGTTREMRGCAHADQRRCTQSPSLRARN